MKASSIIGILVILVIIVIGFAYWNGMPSTDERVSHEESRKGEFGDFDNSHTDADPRTATPIVYTDEGFAPKTVTIEAGETVRFVNQSGEPFWPASDLHPTHSEYSGSTRQAHCEGGGGGFESFDACEPVSSGQSFFFTFNKTGTWGYHDHIQANHTGTIIVK